MKIEIDDAWAENELERQLRCLTPIDDLEEAEYKLNQLKSYKGDENLVSDTQENGELPTEDSLPDSAELFLSLIQHASQAVEQELQECQTLVDKQIEQYTIKTESDENEDEWEEEFILSNATDIIEQPFSSNEDSSSSENKYAEPNLKTYHDQLKLQSDLPMYKFAEVTVSRQADLDEQRKVELEAEAERKTKEEERNRQLENDRKRLEALQQEELKKIEDEMKLAEETLQKELQEHELKIKQLNEQLLIEKKLHEDEVKRLEEEKQRKKNLSAAKIQAHFRGMRTRKEHGAELDKRIAQKKEELMEEQLKYYEELIRKEKEAVEAELEQRKADEEKRKKEEQRAEEIRIRHLEKIRKKEVEETRVKLEFDEKERARFKEEEERSNLMSAQVLHWLKENETDSSGSPLENVSVVKKTEEVEIVQTKAKDTSSPSECASEAISNMSVGEFKKERETLGKDTDLSSANNNLTRDSNQNSPSDQNNMNKIQKVDNFNANQSAVLDNRGTTTLSENDNDRKSKSSFLGNIATKAKNFFKSSSNELSADTRKEEGYQNSDQHGKVIVCSTLSNEDEKILKEKKKGVSAETLATTTSATTATGSAQIKDDSPHIGNETVLPNLRMDLKVLNKDETLLDSKFSSDAPPDPEFLPPSQTQITPPELVQELPPSDKSNSKSTVHETKESVSGLQKGQGSIKSPSPHNLHYKTNPLSYSIDMSLTPHPPVPRVTASLDLSKPRSEVTITSPNLTKASPQAAKAEYRRKRKLRDDVTLARQISDVSRSTTPSQNKTNRVTQINWDFFVSEFKDKYREWREMSLPWNEHPHPPSTASSNRHTSITHPQMEPRIVDNRCLVENYVHTAIKNPLCAEVYMRNCNNCEVTVDQGCGIVKLMSLQHCDECVLNIVNSQIRCLDVTESGLSQLGKVPGRLAMLDLSRNSISRLSPLSCSNLVNLTLSHNCLVSTRGLQYLPSLVYLDLSYNNLSNVQHLDKCGLLQYLDLSHNQLVNVPSLKNNILLTSLELSANGLTSLEELSESWLPCLQKLKLVANGLASLPVLYKICPLLRWLDVSNNMLFDTPEFTGSLQYCQLREVVCDGTELNQDIVNDYVESIKTSPVPESVLVQSFLGIQEQLGLQSLVDSTTMILDKCEYVTERQEQAKKLRYHIVSNTLMDISPSADTTVETKQEEKQEKKREEKPEEKREEKHEDAQKKIRIVAVEEEKIPKPRCDSNEIKRQPDIPSPASTIVHTSHNDDITSRDSMMTSRDNLMTSRDNMMTSRDELTTSRDTSILKLQSLLRGFKSRLRYKNMVEQARMELFKEYQGMVLAARVIQSVWRGYCVRNTLWQWLPWLHRRQEILVVKHKSAVKIQSVYRGYLLRKRLNEVLTQAVYDLSDCEELDEIGSLDFDESECERGWGLPPTPAPSSLQHHIPLPPSRSSSLASTIPQRSITDMSQGPVPLLPLNKLRSREPSRANSLRSVSDISVLSLPPSRHVTPSKRHVAMAAEWGFSNQETAQRMAQRSKKFGKHISDKKKRELVRMKILEGSKRVPLVQSPPPPTAGSAMSSDSVLYQWDDEPLQHSKHNSPHGKQALHTQIYRNPKFSEPAGNVKLPPLAKKPNRPNYSAFR